MMMDRSLYGDFCSRHKEAVAMYKEMMKEDRKLAAFVRQCTMNPLCKKKGIPECILFVTQRITKYPLLIDPLIKTSREQPDECLKLQKVLGFVKVYHHCIQNSVIVLSSVVVSVPASHAGDPGSIPTRNFSFFPPPFSSIKQESIHPFIHPMVQT